MPDEVGLVAAKPSAFFEGVRYVGRVRARRATYSVYGAPRRFLLVWPSRRSANSYYMSEVPASYVEAVAAKFRGKSATSVDVRKRLRGPAFRQLGALIVLVAQRKARIAGSRGRSLLFRVSARA